jgi:hypothetical protein
MAKTGKTEVVLNLKVSDGELSLIFDKAKKGFAQLSKDQKESLKLQEKQDAAARKYSITKTSEGKAIQRTNAETREENRLATLSQANKVKVTKAVEKLTFANSEQNAKVQQHNVLAREQNRIINLELNQSIQLKKSKERLSFAQSQVGQETLNNNKLAIEAERIATLNLDRDTQLAKAQENIAFWTSKKGKELAKANLQAKEAASQASLLAIKEMEAADAAKELSNATKGAAKGFDQMKTTAGLSGAIVTEVGRTISDAPYGLRGMGNNISQLASLFGMFSVNVKKSGRTMKQGFKQLAASMAGPIGIITAIQVVIALLQSGAFGKFYDWVFDTGKEIKNLNKDLIVQADKLRSYVGVLNQANSSQEARLNASQELVKAVKGVSDATDVEKMSNEELTASVEEYIKQQTIRAELDAALEANKELFVKREKIRRVQAKIAAAETKEEQEAIYKANSDIMDVYFDISKEAMEGSGRNLLQRLFGLDEDIDFVGLFKQQSQDSIDEYDAALKKITEIQKKLTGDSGDDLIKSTKRVIKAFKEKSLDFLSEMQGFNEELLDTTYRTQQEIIQDEQDAKKASIELKRDEFKAGEELRLKNYVAQQEANKDLKGADVNAIDAAIERAKVKTAKAKIEADTEATNAIAAIDKVTEARISNQQDLEAFEKENAKNAITESGDATNLAMMPEGMAKVNAEAALDQLRYDNKVAAAKRELTLLTTTEERRREIGNQMALWQDENRATDLKNETNAINEKTRVQQQYISYLSGLGSVLSAIAGKNKNLQKAALIAEKGAAIAKVVIEASKSIGVRTAKNAALLPPAQAIDTPFLAKDIARTKISAGISIAAITAGAAGQLKSINNSGGGSSGGGGGGQVVQAPDFNIIGSTGVNQLANVIGGTTQQPIKAYVVSSEVTSAQELDRNIIDSASL